MHAAPWRALINNMSLFLLLKPRKHPAENPFVHSTAVEQRVLTGCTAVFSRLCTDANPSGTVTAASNDYLPFNIFLKSTACTVPQVSS